MQSHGAAQGRNARVRTREHADLVVSPCPTRTSVSGGLRALLRPLIETIAGLRLANFRLTSSAAKLSELADDFPSHLLTGSSVAKLEFRFARAYRAVKIEEIGAPRRNHLQTLALLVLASKFVLRSQFRDLAFNQSQESGVAPPGFEPTRVPFLAARDCVRTAALDELPRVHVSS